MNKDECKLDFARRSEEQNKNDIPYIYYKDRNNNINEKQLCVKTIKLWAKTKDISKSEQDTIGCQTEICMFTKFIKRDAESMRYSYACPAYVSMENIVAAQNPKNKKPRVCGVFCIEKFCHGSLIDFTCFFMGFIAPNNIGIKLASVIPAGSDIYNGKVKSDHALVQQRFLTTNFSAALAHASRLQSNDNSYEEQMEKHEEVDVISGKTIHQTLPEPQRNNPTIWIYVYGKDIPTESKQDKKIFGTFNLETEVMKRLTVLCAVHNGTQSGKQDIDQQLIRELPIYGKRDMEIARMCMHFLIAATAYDDVLSTWYISTESQVLAVYLKMLIDVDDKLLTLRNNGISLSDINADDTINIWNNLDSYICDIQEYRMGKVAASAKTYLSGIQNRRQVDDRTTGKDELQIALDLVQRCRRYLADNLNLVIDEETFEDPDDETPIDDTAEPDQDDEANINDTEDIPVDDNTDDIDESESEDEDSEQSSEEKSIPVFGLDTNAIKRRIMENAQKIQKEKELREINTEDNYDDEDEAFNISDWL